LSWCGRYRLLRLGIRRRGIFEIGLNSLGACPFTTRSTLFNDFSKVTRLREVDDTSTSSSRTFTGNVGTKDSGKSVHKGAVILTADDFDGGTYHVHLTVTDLVEPSPSKDGRAVLHILGNRDIKLLGAFFVRFVCTLRSVLTTVRIFAGGLDITSSFSRTSSDDTVDSVPLFGITGRSLSVGDTELA
jgi:hypothetical protein